MRSIQVGLLGLVMAMAALGGPITVQNASFEASANLNLGCGAGCTLAFGAPSGWQTSNATLTGVVNPGLPGNTSILNSVPDGNQVVFASDGAVLSQVVGQTAVAGLTYTLQVMVASPKVPSGSVSEEFGDGEQEFVTTEGIVTLRIGNNSVLATGTAASEGNWATYTAVFTAGNGNAGQAISILLESDMSVDGTTSVFFDQVTLSDNSGNPQQSAVPEPAGMGLAGVAALLIAKRYWRR